MFLMVQSYRTSAGGPGCLGSLDRKTSLIATTLGGEFVQFPAVSMFFGGAVNLGKFQGLRGLCPFERGLTRCVSICFCDVIRVT